MKSLILALARCAAQLFGAGGVCRVTIGEAIHGLLNIGRQYSLPIAAMDAHLDWLHSKCLPEGNRLPGSYTLALKALQPYVQPVQRVSACVNGCTMYTGASEGLNHCDVCGEPATGPNGNPRRCVYYAPVASSIAGMLAIPEKNAMLRASSGAHSSDRITDYWGEFFSNLGQSATGM